MLALAVLALASPTVRPRIQSGVVEAPLVARAETSPSTRSGRTEAQSALDAERAFAADAQALGQWTAFRKWAARDATMFVPQPINAQTWLKDRKDPAKAIDWWPTASYVSCDGSLAVNTGGWKRPDGSVGYFTTVWRREPNGSWKWRVDRGDGLAVSRPTVVDPSVRTAACPAQPIPVRRIGYRYGGSDDGASRDGSLQFHWWYGGAASLEIELWDGHAFVSVIIDHSPLSK